MEPLVLPGTLDSLGEIGRYVKEFAETAGLEKKAAYNLRLAIDEIATNVVIHGYEEGGITGELTLRGELSEEAAVLILEDTAREYDPRTQSLPADLDQPLEERSIGGLGVFLAIRSVDRFDYKRVDGRNLNVFQVSRPPKKEMEVQKGKIGVLIEAHFDETEYNRFNQFFPEQGYEVEYLTYLWGQPSLAFKGNDFTAEATVRTCVTQVKPSDYRAIILIGGYAMDRLRYQEKVYPGEENRAPAVEFLRAAVKEMERGRLAIGTICHSLWLFCADPSLLKGRKVTCAHNILCDVEAAGGEVVYQDGQTAELAIDGNLLSGKHPGVVEEFMQAMVRHLDGMTVGV